MWPAMLCPEDGLPLADHDSELSCSQQHRWRIHGGIPRLAPSGHYTDSFGLQWNIYRRTQLDSYTETTISRDRARRCLGEECWAFLHRPAETHVLEVGCGAGRFTEVLLSTGAYVTSVDLSNAVEANQANFPQGRYHRIVQADAYQLPFAQRQFDVVVCLGVIQHTPNPRATIASLFSQVKPGGWLVIDHYTYNLSEFTKTAFWLRLLLRHMRPETSLRVVNRLVTILFPLHQAIGNRRILHSIVSRFSPILTYHHTFPLSTQHHREWSLLDSYDSLTDFHRHYLTRRQIRSVLHALGAVEIVCEYGGNGVEARCRPLKHHIDARGVNEDLFYR
jgi:2-polyprenyl-3-methyl-5-hydroxy-6-metoxy-1,4-benzoquinol methylase